MTKINKLPLAIKIPILLAGFLSLVLVFVTFFENVPESAGVVHQCQLKYTGPVKVGNENVSLLTHLFKDADGRYSIAGLDKDRSSWLIGKMGFAADFSPYWELRSRQQSSLRSAEKHRYEFEASFGDWAFVKDENGRRIPLHVANDKVVEKNSLGLCTGNWQGDVSVRRLNNNQVVFWNSKGQVGFYDLSKLMDFIPKGVSRSADLLMVVDPGSTLSVGDCRNLAENRQARVRADEGLFGFSSGTSSTLNLYQVAKDQIKLTPLQLPVANEQFSDFVLGGPSVFGVKVSGWLDRTETWKLTRLADLIADKKEKSVMTAKPLEFRDDYSLDGKAGQSGYWVAEQYKSRFFFDRYLISFVNQEGTKTSYDVDDSVVKAALAQKSIWSVLPGNRHLFVGEMGDSAQYSVVECGTSDAK
ncbi:MAG: hypothetical protein J7501_17870 [Bdellovibrio sp.]|nr:hypothetical protein [Bdellovibrio sp.]